jgi:hypoxanthine phosphoribosyltransferase
MADTHSNPAHAYTDAVEVVIAPEAIAARIDEIAKAIAIRKLANLVVVAILKGSFVFAADLIRALHKAGISPEVDFMTLSSYKTGTISSGDVTIVRDMETDVTGRNVLIVDDILESGRTLAFAKDLIAARGAKVVATCVLLEKAGLRAVKVEADFKAFDCPRVFVVGYGMDVANRYRELPFVGRLVQS